MSGDDPRPIYRVSWGLLGEWWCARVDADELACAKVVHAEWAAAHMSIVPVSLVRDRLYGGFPCAEDPNRRHVYFATGQYTYTNPEANSPLDDEERREQWKRVIEANGEPGNGPFTHAGAPIPIGLPTP